MKRYVRIWSHPPGSMRQHSIVLNWQSSTSSNDDFYHYTIARNLRLAYRALRQGSWSQYGGGWNEGINSDAARRVLFDTLFACNIATTIDFQVISSDNPDVKRTP